jgi:hypothetical protein
MSNEEKYFFFRISEEKAKINKIAQPLTAKEKNFTIERGKCG